MHKADFLKLKSIQTSRNIVHFILLHTLYVSLIAVISEHCFLWTVFAEEISSVKKKIREKSRECHNQKPQPFPDTKRRKRKPTNPNKHKSNKRTKSTKIISLFPKRGNRNAKRTEKHKNKITQSKT